jgi:hypothetical protein
MDLDTLGITKLKEVAKNHGVSGYSKYNSSNRQELANMIKKHIKNGSKSPKKQATNKTNNTDKGLHCNMKLSQCNNTNKYKALDIRNLAPTCGVQYVKQSRKVLCDEITSKTTRSPVKQAGRKTQSPEVSKPKKTGVNKKTPKSSVQISSPGLHIEKTDRYVCRNKAIYSRSELLSVYQEALMLCLEKESKVNGKYKLWHTIDNFGKFNELSNNGLILIESKLSMPDIGIPMGILSMLWSDYLGFCESDLDYNEILDFIQDCLDGKDVEFNHMAETEDQNNPDEGIDYSYIEELEGDEERIFWARENMLSDFKSCSEWKGRRKQGVKIFKIQDIIREFCTPFIKD